MRHWSPWSMLDARRPSRRLRPRHEESAVVTTSLRAEPYRILAADIGQENPLPQFRGDEDDARVNVADNVPEEDRRYLGWRTARRVLPYRLQDGYDRGKREQDLP